MEGEDRLWQELGQARNPEASPAHGALLPPVRLHLPKVLQPSKRVPQLSIKYSNI